MRTLPHPLLPALALLLLGALAAGCAPDAGSESGDAAEVRPIPDSIRIALERMGAEDQEARDGLGPEKMQDTLFLREMMRGDSARSLRLREIVERHGWPDSARVGVVAARAAFLILQHSPLHAFQAEMLPALEERAREGEMPRDEVAMLVDRVRMHEGAPQRYGTQFQMADGRLVLYEVEERAALAERRRAMGLPPMGEYVRMLVEIYGMPVDTIQTEDRSP